MLQTYSSPFYLFSSGLFDPGGGILDDKKTPKNKKRFFTGRTQACQAYCQALVS